MAKRIEHEVIDVETVGFLDIVKEKVKRLCLNIGALCMGVVFCDAVFLDKMGMTALKDYALTAKAAPVPESIIFEKPDGEKLREALDAQIPANEPPPTWTKEDVDKIAIEVLEGEFNIPRPIWRAILAQESKADPYAFNFEPTKVDYSKQFAKTPYEAKLYATSWGPWQIMGYNVPRINKNHGTNYTLKDLIFDLRASTTMAGMLISDCYHDKFVQDGPTTRERVTRLFRCHNGSGPKTLVYAKQIMPKFDEQLLYSFDLNIKPTKDTLGDAIAKMDMNPKKKPKKDRVDIAALRPEEGEPFIAEGRE